MQIVISCQDWNLSTFCESFHAIAVKDKQKINNFYSIGLKTVDEQQAFSRYFEMIPKMKKNGNWGNTKQANEPFSQVHFKRMLYECYRKARMFVSIKIIPQIGNAKWTSNRWITDRNNVNWLRWNKTEQLWTMSKIFI